MKEIYNNTGKAQVLKQQIRICKNGTIKMSRIPIVVKAFPYKPNNEKDKEEHKKNISAVKIITLILSSLFKLFLFFLYIVVPLILYLVLISCAAIIFYCLPMFIGLL